MEKIKEKLDQYIPGAPGQTSLKKEILTLAMNELGDFCLSGLRSFEQDQEYISRMLSQNLINQDTLLELKEILLKQKNLDGYEVFLVKKQQECERIYAKYFHSYTVVNPDGTIHNSILDMDWNKENGIWEKRENGVYSFTLFMPYQEMEEVA